MIAPAREDVSAPAATQANPKPAPLPDFRRLAAAAGWINAPLLAVFLLGGKPWLAGSVLVGLALSLSVCGFLYLFVAVGMNYITAGLGGRGSAAGKNGALGQFVLLLPVKFLILAGIGWALLTLHGIHYGAVLAGFALAQAAIVFTATRHFQKR